MALPVCSPAPVVATNQAFTLVAKVICSTLGLDIENWVISGVHSGAGQNLVIVTNASPTDPIAGALYQNGTLSTSPYEGVANINLLGVGTGTIPYGLTVTNFPAGSDNYTVGLNLGTGTKGNGIELDKNGYPFLVGNDEPYGHWVVCNQTLFTETPLQALFWRPPQAPELEGCAEIMLVPQCDGTVGNETTFTQNLLPAKCVTNAVAFDPQH